MKSLDPESQSIDGRSNSIARHDSNGFVEVTPLLRRIGDIRLDFENVASYCSEWSANQKSAD